VNGTKYKLKLDKFKISPIKLISYAITILSAVKFISPLKHNALPFTSRHV